MTVVKVVETCDVPVGTAFEYVNDYRNFTKWIDGAQSFEPVTEQTEGVGAKFDGAVKVGPLKLTSRVDVVRWEKDDVIAVKSIKGFEVESTFVFHAETETSCLVDAFVDYRVPGGLAGRVMGRTLEPLMKVLVKRTADKLKAQVIAYYAEQQR